MNQNKKEKAAFFSTVGYGIHSKINKWLSETFETEFKTKAIFFYEYFLSTPLTREKDISSAILYAPYLLRILNEQKFLPMINNEQEIKNWKNIYFSPNSPKNILAFWAHGGKGIELCSI